MLGMIKSSYFIKFLFSLVDEKVKLKIIKYNISLQTELEISFFNYPIFSGRKIIVETDGKGKEIQLKDKRLIFEGEYLNGKRNGKGKEYAKKKYLMFGMFSNLFRDIEGKDNNYVKFEGEYLNGKRNGKGKEYDENGELLYEGEYLNGKRHGKGKEYFDDELIFEGEYLNDKKWKGKGYDFTGKIIYELDNNDSCGKEVDDFGNPFYEGEYLAGERNGKGKEYNLCNKLIFEGMFLKGKKWSGKGYDGLNNCVYELNNGKGLVKEYYSDNNNLMFEGEYINGERNGKGKEFGHDGDLEFEGEYLNGERNGKGKEYDQDGDLEFEGEYLKGMRNGKGKSYDKGSLLFEGETIYR